MRVVSDDGLDVIAYTMLGEAANQGRSGLQAVANVIKNRAQSGDYSDDPVKVALQHNSRGIHQFSAWNSTQYGGNTPMQRYDKASSEFKNAKRIARAVLNGDLPDNTGGATFYHTRAVNPTWDDHMYTTAEIGDHVFYSPHPTPPADVGGAGTLSAFIAPTPADITQRPNVSVMAYAGNPHLAEASGLRAIDAATSGEKRESDGGRESPPTPASRPVNLEQLRAALAQGDAIKSSDILVNAVQPASVADKAKARQKATPARAQVQFGINPAAALGDVAQQAGNLAAGSIALGDIITKTAKETLNGDFGAALNEITGAFNRLKKTPDIEIPGLAKAEKVAAAVPPIPQKSIAPDLPAVPKQETGHGLIGDLLQEGIRGIGKAIGGEMPTQLAGAVAEHLFDGLLSTVQGRTGIIDPILYGFQSPGSIDNHPESRSGGITQGTAGAAPGTTFTAGGYTYRVNSDHSTTNLKTGHTYGGTSRPVNTGGGDTLDGSPFW